VLSKLHYFNESFGELSSSPYRERLFVLFDKNISTKINRVVSAGVKAENITLLSRNGIEYYYPCRIVCDAFRCDLDKFDEIQLANNIIEYNGHRFSKIQLSKYVVDNLKDTDLVDPEIDSLLNKLAETVQI
jgi:hypothetical protein